MKLTLHDIAEAYDWAADKHRKPIMGRHYAQKMWDCGTAVCFAGYLAWRNWGKPIRVPMTESVSNVHVSDVLQAVHDIPVYGPRIARVFMCGDAFEATWQLRTILEEAEAHGALQDDDDDDAVVDELSDEPVLAASGA